MQTVSGQVARFLEGPRGTLHGLVLDGGQVVRFPAEKGHLVSLIVSVGSHVGVEGTPHPLSETEDYWEPVLITNFDSKRSISFLAPKSQVRPGMLSPTHPHPAASLVHPDVSSTPETSSLKALGDQQARGAHGASTAFADERTTAQPSSHSHPPLVTRQDAAASIGQSYDCLHRVQAILAYLHIMKRSVPGIGQLLDEAKHTYEQALARYQARSYVAATEFACASASLSRVVEILISRTVRSDDSLPSLVPPPPDLYSQSTSSTDVEHSLAETESVLSRIHWLLEHGTLPLEDRTQVRRIASWGDALYKQAKHSYRQASMPDAVELAQAALAGAHSAEHVCRKWYVGQTVRSPDRPFASLRPH